jgi:xanthine dehydrogenase small subunit
MNDSNTAPVTSAPQPAHAASDAGVARPVRFFHRGQTVEVTPRQSTRTVLEWLREDARCTGTKEGCAEGDCGACTVVLGQLDAAGALQLQPVNACIQFLPTLDGKALFTVEDLAGMGQPATDACVQPSAAAPTLHPVQQSLVACHGSQCGFCTPGFVMSLWACYEKHQQAGTVPTRQQLADDLSGNLCRCTGYRPILDAGQQMFSAPAQTLSRAVVEQSLMALAQDPPLSTADGFHAPRTLAQFAALRQAKPQAKVLAGSTDMGLWVTKQFKNLGELIAIGGVAELRRVEVLPTHIHIGAAASLEQAWGALAVEWPTLRDVWLRFASLPIRHAGTMGGNVANGSPIGDSAPVLMALDATIVLQQGDRVRRLLLQDFYVDYMKNRLEPGEFVQALEVPRRRAGQQVQVYKISKRFDCDISAVCAAFAVVLDGDRVANIRLAFGGMAAIVKRAALAEAALLNQPWTEASLQAAQTALSQDFKPLSDMRASAAYRMQVAQNLLRRLWLQTRPHAPLLDADVSVWARQEQT